jgi:DNA-binding IclR family transcriptional regulator
VQVAVLEKAFAIIEAMERLGRPLPLRRVSEETGIPKATAYRILHSLVAMGYAMQDPASGHYQLTAKLAQLGHVERYDGLLARALPLMEGLYGRFDETTNLGVLEGEKVHYLHSLETNKPLRWIVHAGSSDPFHCTALGRAIAAFLTESQIDSVLAQVDFEKRTANSPGSAGEVLEILARVRANGWALDHEENDDGVCCLAVPLIDDGIPVASISMSIPKQRVTNELEESVVQALLEVGAHWQREFEAKNNSRALVTKGSRDE